MMLASVYKRRVDEIFEEILKHHPKATVAIDPKTGRTFVYDELVHAGQRVPKIIAIIGAWKASHRPGLVLEARMPNGHEPWAPAEKA